MKKNLHQKTPIDTRTADDQFAARLLSRRDDITIQEKESVLSAVLAQTTRDATPAPAGFHRWRWAISAAAAIFIAAIAVFRFWPSSWSPGYRTAGSPVEFTPKGDGYGTPFFEIQCLRHGRTGPCSTGSSLVFTVKQTAPVTYFSALAVRQDDGTVIWMYPASPGGKSIPVPARHTPLQSAILLDSHYPAGKYSIIGVLSQAPLNRSQIKNHVMQYKREGQRTRRTPRHFPVISELFIEVKDHI